MPVVEKLDALLGDLGSQWLELEVEKKPLAALSVSNAKLVLISILKFLFSLLKSARNKRYFISFDVSDTVLRYRSVV